MFQRHIEIRTQGRGFVDITGDVRDHITQSGVATGLAHVFLRHTSAGLLLQDNTHPDVLRDLEAWLSRNILDGDPSYLHTAEGNDGMSAHLRAMLTRTALTLPISGGEPALGTWQAIYVFEHRTQPHVRKLVLTIQGEPAEKAADDDPRDGSGEPTASP